jgi:hypothetical protein
MFSLKNVFFILLLFCSVIKADLLQSSLDKNITLECSNMNMKNDMNNKNDPYLRTDFKYKDYIIHHNTVNSDAIYEIIKEKKVLKKLSIKDASGTAIHTNGKYCGDLNQSEYFIFEYEVAAENYDGSGLSGKGLFIIDACDKNDIKKLFLGIFYDQYLKGTEKIKSQYKIYSGYTPPKLLKQDRYLPITYTLFEKDGGLYMKVGSTYKSDIITLKKLIEKVENNRTL